MKHPLHLDSYQPQATADPFYAVVGDPMFERLQGIIDERQTLDDLKLPLLKYTFGSRHLEQQALMWLIAKM